MGKLTLFVLMTVPGLAVAVARPYENIGPAAQVPEPSTMALLAGAAAAAGVVHYLKKRGNK